MPIYEYRCENGHLLEVMQKITEDPITECSECGAPVKRVFHPIAVHFKGKGFYNTDYGTKKRAREKDAHESSKKKAEKSESSGDSAKGESKSDSAKTEAKSSSSDSPSSSSASSSTSSTAGSKPAKS